MNRFRLTCTVVLSTALLALAGCGEEDSTSTADSAPSASAAATSTAPSAAAPSSSTGATGGASDKELCQNAKSAGDEMKGAFLTAMQSGKEPEPAVFQEIMKGLEQKMVTAAKAGGDGKVAGLMRDFATEAAKVAAAADPGTAAASPAFEKVGKDLSAACKAVGVNATF
ncbi:hypothetical protein [Micromonospora sp. KLBMP9576]|uniref:hypothetical protein n=1 Tax=Micromonospora sp. KLBMP9576 TaxID=3424769 RepID=UPI003D90FEB9